MVHELAKQMISFYFLRRLSDYAMATMLLSVLSPLMFLKYRTAIHSMSVVSLACLRTHFQMGQTLQTAFYRKSFVFVSRFYFFLLHRLFIHTFSMRSECLRIALLQFKHTSKYNHKQLHFLFTRWWFLFGVKISCFCVLLSTQKNVAKWEWNNIQRSSLMTSSFHLRQLFPEKRTTFQLPFYRNSFQFQMLMLTLVESHEKKRKIVMKVYGRRVKFAYFLFWTIEKNYSDVKRLHFVRQLNSNFLCHFNRFITIFLWKSVN